MNNRRPFETVEAIDTRAEWNALRAQLTETQALAWNITEMWLDGVNVTLTVGDVLLIVAENAGSIEASIKRAASIEPDASLGSTKVSLAEIFTGAKNVAAPEPGVYVMRDAQLQHVPEPFKLIYDTYDCRIVLLSDLNTKELSNVDPAKVVMRSQARRELMKTMMRRTAAGEFRWVVASFPTNAYAQDAEMSLSEYEDFVYNACMPDMNDPIGYWKKIDAWQGKIVKWLEGKKTVHVKGKETDLRLSIEGRKFENCNGKLTMPDGEVFTGPVENSAEGHVYFSYPAIENGREVTGIRLTFEKGKCVKEERELGAAEHHGITPAFAAVRR